MLQIYPRAQEIVNVTAIRLPYVTAILKLSKVLVSLTPGIVTGDLTPGIADFNGYANKTLVALPPIYVDFARGGLSFQIPTQTWIVGDPVTTGNTIFGGWIEDAGGLLLYAWMVPGGWDMTHGLQAMSVDFIFNYFGTEVNEITINGQSV